MLNQYPLPHYFSADHEAFRAALRNFVAREITPLVNEWDEAGSFPRSLYGAAAKFGALGVGYPEQYGGTPADIFFKVVLAEEYARCGCGGVVASLNSHSIGLPPILAAGSDALKARVIPPVLRGEKNFRAGGDRACWWLRRCCRENTGSARRRPLRAQWRKDLYHIGDARGFHHRRGAH